MRASHTSRTEPEEGHGNEKRDKGAENGAKTTRLIKACLFQCLQQYLYKPAVAQGNTEGSNI